ncbi:hypothetical protein N7468_010762 [Penicillium chermesinum]|uniref:CST complex subunit Ten1 n=1 Tax=Penicillium chermesinum TaxID=63820 RepID=A0A9W9N888_9EURO|nr:uncharacterized protein N7468_010762 [Penicillium chermesinum]KAJ5215083.1 hypothetical protein N7468_010762 [Penicillium chermesinum]KAJ6141426.1 hypothetical protein N7470_009816 [Penicillium chermesinum]
MENGPRPSTRAFLCDLSELATGSKVRFLGCVRQYNFNEGHLVLEHHYPRNKPQPSSVTVDVNAVLENMNAEQLRVGAWLNIMGYIRDANTSSSFTSSQMDSQSESSQSSPGAMSAGVTPRPVCVEAVMVFSAGAIAVGDYERILRQAQEVEQRINQ